MLLDIRLAMVFLRHNLPFFPTRRTWNLFYYLWQGSHRLVENKRGWSERNLTNIDSFSGHSNIKLEIEKKHSQKEVTLSFHSSPPTENVVCIWCMWIYVFVNITLNTNKPLHWFYNAILLFLYVWFRIDNDALRSWSSFFAYTRAYREAASSWLLAGKSRQLGENKSRWLDGNWSILEDHDRGKSLSILYLMLEKEC